MIYISNAQKLKSDLKGTSSVLELKFADINGIHSVISEIMSLVKEKIEDYLSVKFYLNENSNVEKYRFIESVIHRYMRAAYFESYKIIFYEEN